MANKYKKEKIVQVRDKDGNTETMSVANSFDMINHCGWTAMGPEQTQTEADAVAATTLAAQEKEALAEGQAIADAMNSKAQADIVQAAAAKLVADAKVEKEAREVAEQEAIAQAAIDKKVDDDNAAAAKTAAIAKEADAKKSDLNKADGSKKATSKKS